jgi:hypothetical protein
MKRGYVFLVLLVIATIAATLYISASNATGEAQSVQSEDKSNYTTVSPGDKAEPVCTTISPGDELQQAIDALPDGGKLILSEGEYNTLEAVVLENRKNLTIVGNGEVWINTKGIDHHVITLKNCENITLSNLKAQHVILEEGDNDPIEDARDGAVIGVIDGSRIDLINCELVGCGIYGVYAHSATPLLIEGCYLHDNAKSAILLTTGSKPVKAIVRGCTIMHNTNSIETRGDIDVQLEGENKIERNSPADYKN